MERKIERAREREQERKKDTLKSRIKIMFHNEGAREELAYAGHSCRALMPPGTEKSPSLSISLSLCHYNAQFAFKLVNCFLQTSLFLL
jgi:hypothetical protein